MLNTNLLLNGIDCDNTYISGKAPKLKITLKDKIINSQSINKIVLSLNYLIKIKCYSHITFIFHCIFFGDDSSLNVFELLVYHMAKKYKTFFVFHFKYLEKKDFRYVFLRESTLFNSITDNIFSSKKYVKNFCSNNYTSTTYRRYIEDGKYKDKRFNIQSIIYSDVYSFCKNRSFGYEVSDKASELVSELVDNVLSHTTSDCILSLRLLNVKNKFGKELKLLSISVINLSLDILGKKIRNTFYEDLISKKSKEIINKALKNVGSMFNEKFTEDDFFLISSFQKGISSRIGREDSGTGLTILIKNLIEHSFDNYCYAYSGNSILYFKKDYLNLDKDGLIGFSKNNTYYDGIPDNNAFEKANYYFNGTIFNIVLIMEDVDE